MNKRNTENDPPYPDGPQKDYHRAEYKSKERLIKRIEFLEALMKNLAIMHDGQYHGTTIFKMLDRNFIDKDD